MKITKDIKEGKLNIAIEGRLDTVTAPELKNEISDLSGITSAVIDMSGCEYVSSAGLRVLLLFHKSLMDKEGLTITGVNEDVMEIMEVTKFSEVLNIVR